MLMGSSDSKMQQSEQALKDAILRVAQEGIPPNEVAVLRRLVMLSQLASAKAASLKLPCL